MKNTARSQVQHFVSPRQPRKLEPLAINESTVRPRLIRNTEPSLHNTSKTPTLPSLFAHNDDLSVRKEKTAFQKSILSSNFQSQRVATDSQTNLSLKDLEGDFLQQFKEFLNAKAAQQLVSPTNKKAFDKTPHANLWSNDTRENNARNIHDIVKKVQDKRKILKVDETRKFEKKLSVFNNLSTFIDIKNFLPKLSAPDEQQFLDSLALSFQAKGLIKGDSPVKRHPTISRKKRTLSPLKLSPAYIEKLNELKETQRRKLKAFQSQSQSKLLNYSSKVEEEFKKNEPELAFDMIRNDTTDENQFYDKLESNLRDNKYDREDFDVPDVDEENAVKFEDYLKKILSTRQVQQEDLDDVIKAQHSQLKTFKDRSEKVISLLKKATKNIFRKNLEVTVKKKKPADLSQSVLERKLSLSHQPSRMELSSSTKDLTSIDPVEEEVEEDHGRVFLTNLVMEPDHVPEPGFRSKLNHILERVDRISSEPSSSKRGSYQSIYRNAKQKSPEYASNKQVSLLLSKCVDVLMEEADYQKDGVNTYKKGFDKVCSNMSSIYEKDLDVLSPKPTPDSKLLEIKLNHKEHFGSFLGKPVKLRRKNLRGIYL